MTSLLLPSPGPCLARVYVDVGIDRSNKYVYDVLHAHLQTKMPQESYKVGEIDTKTSLGSTIKGHTLACHFAQRESETTLAGIKATDTYMQLTSWPFLDDDGSLVGFTQC